MKRSALPAAGGRGIASRERPRRGRGPGLAERDAGAPCQRPSYRRADLTLWGQDEWFRRWAESGDGALDAAVAGFARREATPEERFGGLADAARTAAATGLIAEADLAVMAFGSLLGFAVDPERLPFVLRRPFAELERLLSVTSRSDGQAARRRIRRAPGLRPGRGGRASRLG